LAELEVTFGGREGLRPPWAGKKTCAEICSESLRNLLDETGLGNDPRMIEVAAEMMTILEEGKKRKKMNRGKKG